MAFIVLSIFYTGNLFAQQVDTIKTKGKVSSSTWKPDPSLLKGEFSSPNLDLALSRLKKAQIFNNVGIGIGCANHLILIINGALNDGSPFTNFDEGGPVLNIFGGLAGLTRMGLSPVPPILLHKAEQALIRLQQDPGNERKFQQSLKNIRIAKHLTTAVPVLGLTAVGLMIGGYVYDGQQGGPTNVNGYFIAAWAVMGATLGTTIAATLYMSKAKEILLNESGSFSLGINQDGVGMKFRIGARR